MNPLLLLCSGAVAGALARWLLSLWLNPVLQPFAAGTLAVNLIGSFAIGAALGWNLNDAGRLLLISGFLGSFTTFSAFSAEVAEKLLQGRWTEALWVMGLHNVGGVAACVAGVMLVRQLVAKS